MATKKEIFEFIGKDQIENAQLIDILEQRQFIYTLLGQETGELIAAGFEAVISILKQIDEHMKQLLGEL